MKTAAQVFIIIGMVFGCWMILPLIFGGIALSQMSKGQRPSTGMSVCVLLFCNMIGGILLLCAKDEDFYKPNMMNNGYNPNMNNGYNPNMNNGYNPNMNKTAELMLCRFCITKAAFLSLRLFSSYFTVSSFIISYSFTSSPIVSCSALAVAGMPLSVIFSASTAFGILKYAETGLASCFLR